MSHVATVAVEIRDLDALKAAAIELGAAFLEGKKTYKWYGTSVGDYPLPKGMTKEMLGKCSHVIRVPGVEYEIGVVALPNGGWTLAYDFWGPGEGLLKALGKDCQKLVQMYGVHKATIEAKRKGYRVNRNVLTNGRIQLKISGMR